MQSRKEFIKSACGFIMISSALGITLSGLQSCQSVKVISASDNPDGIIRIKTSEFINEKDETQKFVKLRSKKHPFDILLVKINDTSYNAIYMMCSHQEQPLNASSGGLFCSAHGSKFDFNGKVLNEPATQPLKTFKTELNNDEILIYTK